MEVSKNKMQGEDFKKRFEYLKKKIKNKRVIIYGAGNYLKEISKYCNLNELNVVGVTDRKFLTEDKDKKVNGFSVVPYVLFNPCDCDCVLVVLERPFGIYHSLKKRGVNVVSFKEFSKNKLVNKIKKFLNKFKPKNNVFVLVKKDGRKIYNPKIKKLKVKMEGKNNYLEINEPFYIREKVCVTMGSDSSFVIGANNKYKNVEFILGSCNKVQIGNCTTIQGAEVYLNCAKNTSLTIGNDVMIAWNVSIRANDAHVVYDLKTKEVINSPKDIVICDHVWIAANTTVLKGVHIPKNCVIGTCSMVNKKFEQENCIIAGSPAKVIKTGINWDRRPPMHIDKCK